MKILDRLAALNASTLPHREWSVATVLARYADDDSGECWPSVRTIASSSKMGERTVREAIGELERLGIIELPRRSKGRSSHRFRLRLDLLSPSPNPADPAGLEGEQPGSGCRVEPGNSRRVGNATRQMPPGNPADGAPQPCGSRSATTKEQTREHQHHRAQALAGTDDRRRAPGGGGDSSNGVGGFDGDLTQATDALARLGVNGARGLAQLAESNRTVEWIIERSTAQGVKRPDAMAAKLIRDGERPPGDWRPKAERTSAQTPSAILGDRTAQASDHQRAGARDKAEKALIARHPSVADAAVERFLADGLDVDGLVARKAAPVRRTHRLTRQTVMAAIESETGERAQPGPSNNGRPRRATEQASC